MIRFKTTNALLISVLILISINSCKQLPAGVVRREATIVIPATPSGFNCTILHPTPANASSNRFIEMQVDISVYYYDRTTARTRMASTSQRYIPANTNSQLTFTLEVAEDKPYEIEMIYTGLEPAECATSFGGGVSPDVNCTAGFIFVNGQIRYNGARPRWEGFKSFQQYQQNIVLTTSNTRPIPNVVNSCGYVITE